MSTLYTKCYFLQLAGLKVFHLDKNKSSYKCFFFIACFKLWFIVACATSLYHIYREIIQPSAGLTIILSFIMLNFSSCIRYLAMWQKRKQLLELSNIITTFGIKTTSKGYFLLNILQILNFIMFLILPAILYYFHSNDSSKSFVESFGTCVVTYAYVFNQITLPFFITLIHGSICVWCSTALHA